MFILGFVIWLVFVLWVFFLILKLIHNQYIKVEMATPSRILSSDPGGGGLIAENGVFTSCRLKTDFHCCNP